MHKNITFWTISNCEETMKVKKVKTMILSLAILAGSYSSLCMADSYTDYLEDGWTCSESLVVNLVSTGVQGTIISNEFAFSSAALGGSAVAEGVTLGSLTVPAGAVAIIGSLGMIDTFSRYIPTMFSVGKCHAGLIALDDLVVFGSMILEESSHLSLLSAAIVNDKMSEEDFLSYFISYIREYGDDPRLRGEIQAVIDHIVNSI